MSSLNRRRRTNREVTLAVQAIPSCLAMSSRTAGPSLDGTSITVCPESNQMALYMRRQPPEYFLDVATYFRYEFFKQ